jgi:hypothetical protein
MKVNKKITAMIILFIILAGMTGLGAAALRSSNFQLKTFSTFEAADKIKDAQRGGGSVLLSSSEVNELMQLYLKKGISKGSLELKGANADIKDDSITLYIPCSIKRINLLITTGGKVDYKSGQVVSFEPDYFKLGSLPMPKGLVLKAVRKIGNPNISVSSNSIDINKKVIPFQVKAINLQGDNLYMYIDKFTPKGIFDNNAAILNNAKDELEKAAEKVTNAESKQKIENVIKDIDNAIQNPGNDTSNLIDKVNEELKDISSDTDGNIKKVQDEINITNDEKKRQELQKVNGELGTAAAALSSPASKQIIYMMQGTVSRLIANPSYNYKNDAATVKAVYGKLSAKDKQQFKSALLQHIDSSLIIDLRSAFGL